MARDRDGPDAGSAPAVAGRARCRDDGSRDRKDRFDFQGSEEDQHAGGGGARHGVRSRDRRRGDGDAYGQPACAGTDQRHRGEPARTRGLSRRCGGLTMLLSMNNVTSYYGKTPILKDVSFGLDEGKCLCVLGRNGVGKTTLMRTIMGLTDRSVGDISVNGRNISGTETYPRAKLGIGYVPQARGLRARVTGRENILLGTFARPDGIPDVPEICLRLVPYLKANLDRRARLP